MISMINGDVFIYDLLDILKNYNKNIENLGVSEEVKINHDDYKV